MLSSQRTLQQQQQHDSSRRKLKCDWKSVVSVIFVIVISLSAFWNGTNASITTFVDYIAIDNPTTTISKKNNNKTVGVSPSVTGDNVYDSNMNDAIGDISAVVDNNNNNIAIIDSDNKDDSVNVNNLASSSSSSSPSSSTSLHSNSNNSTSTKLFKIQSQRKL